MRKIIKNKKMGILMIGLILTQAQVRAGWFSGFGDRLINGVANTIQTNISQKANKTVDDALDGKLGNKPNNKKTNSKNQETSITPTQEKVSGQPSTESVESKVSYTSKRGKALRVTGKYEEVDAGIFRFKAEPIYDKELRIGQTKIEIDEFLDPGYYAIWVNPSSRTHSVSAMYEHEEKGLEWGFGIKTVKRIFNNGPYNMLGNKEGLLHIVEILPGTQGHLELTVVNSQERMGTAEVMIYHIPGPNLEIIK